METAPSCHRETIVRNIQTSLTDVDLGGADGPPLVVPCMGAWQPRHGTSIRALTWPPHLTISRLHSDVHLIQALDLSKQQEVTKQQESKEREVEDGWVETDNPSSTGPGGAKPQTMDIDEIGEVVDIDDE